jgi:hypothetical protein
LPIEIDQVMELTAVQKEKHLRNHEAGCDGADRARPRGCSILHNKRSVRRNRTLRLRCAKLSIWRLGKMPKKRCKRRKLSKKKGAIVRGSPPEALLKYRIRRHFTRMGFTKADDGSLVLPGSSKEVIRALHGDQRAERLESSAAFLSRGLPNALPCFANGWEIDPAKIELRLIRVHSRTKESELFRRARRTGRPCAALGCSARLVRMVAA